MDVWLDLTNAPHVHYFSQLIKKFEKEGIDYLITTRKSQNLEELLNIYGFEYICVGKHGESLKDKLIYSAKRIIELTEIVDKEKPKVAIAKHSVELPRVSFGLGIPVIFVVDNEHAEAQNKLTLPLAEDIIIPIGTKKSKLKKMGGNNFTTFNGTCEVANVNSRLKGILPIDKGILKKLGIDNNNPTIVMRARPNSSYCNGKKDIIPKIIEKLREKIDCNIVAFPRDEKQREKYISLNAIVPNTIDALSLLYFADAMIGAGGTMNREAAVLGIPTVSCYPKELLGVDKYLIKMGRMVHIKNVNRIVGYIIENLGVKNKNVELEDPTDLMFEKVCSYLKR
ncbi:DUF354 domain-containing protein [Methanotorris formicicus]|uniref:DUF354 domain-containing protein n=1 Tax=Methanotorris formicicus Mc-S-70 TaxID=647171 RepID=H1KYA1_9EURY|nr:DUF354 domain-containing protein [Methanotorris formicicus]EHP87366.1 protein of unknown function DUF354 [Methanotorris formicicus Mc-S-70]